MAKTIEQIQAMITNKADPREIINEIADYLEANPGGSGGGVGSVTGDLVDDSDPLNPIVNLPNPLPAVDGSQLTNLPPASLGYLVYTALLSQSGVNAPTASVKRNTLGGVITFQYDSPGFYHIISSGLFSTGKTIIISSPWWDSGDEKPYFIAPLYNAISINDIPFVVTDSQGIYEDDAINGIPIEIQVYP